MVGAIVLALPLAVSGPPREARAEDELKVEIVDPQEVLESILPPDALQTALASLTEGLQVVPTVKAAGAWVDDATQQLTVGVVGQENAAAVTQALNAQGITDFVIKLVTHTQEELDAIVDGVYDNPELSSISSATHDYQSNVVVLTSTEQPTDALRAAIYNRYGDAAVIESEPLVPETMATRDADRSAFWAGAWVGSWGGGTFCTLGFSWIAENGGPRMLSAGHCWPVGTDYSLDVGTPDKYGATYSVGRVIASTYDEYTGTMGSNGDLSLINTVWNREDGVLNRQGGPRMWTGGTTSSTSTPIVGVTKWTNNGRRVCYSGMRRGVQCGATIQDDGDGGYTVIDPDASYRGGGIVVRNQARATKGWGRCVIPGDSGAPVYINTPGIGVSAHGILSGAVGGGDDRYVGKYEPSHCAMWFTEIGQAYQQWPGGRIETQG